MNAGTPPGPGASRLTLRTYRVDGAGRRTGGERTRVHAADGDPAVPPDSWAWPPCRCHRCGAADRAEELLPALRPEATG